MRLLEHVESLAHDCYGPAAAVTSDRGPTGYFVQVRDKKGLQMHVVRGERNQTAALRRMRDILLTKMAEVET